MQHRPTELTLVVTNTDVDTVCTNFQNVVWSIEGNWSSNNTLRVNATPTDLSNSLDGTAATAQAAVIFFLNKNTLLLSQNGIDVQR